jgi:DNA-binding response OmpR family regulator
VSFFWARLVRLVWPEGRVRSRTLDVHISWLRHKLRTSSVRVDGMCGIGYRLPSTTETLQAG